MFERMWKALTGTSAKAQQIQLQEEARTAKAETSQRALMMAASTTMDLAGDITVQLRQRLDDVQKQIDTTTLLIPDALIITDQNGVIETFNPAAEKMFGYRARSIKQEPITRLFRLDDEELDFDILQHVVARKGKYAGSDATSQIMGCRKNGSQFYPNVRLSQFERSDGSHMLFLIEDITEEREAQEQFHALSARQASMLSALPDVLATFDAEDRYTSFWCPPNFGRSFGFTEAVGKHIGELFEPDHAARLKAHLDEVRGSSGVVTWEYVIVSEDGTPNYYEARSTMTGTEVLVLVRNTTALVKAQNSLVESVATFKAFGLASSEAMMVHKPGGIVDWNPRLSEMTGYSSQEIANMGPLDFVHPLERERISPFFEDNTARAYETLLLKKNGDTLEVAINTKPIEWKNANARIKVIQDITPFKDFDYMLHVSRERYKSITENTIDLVVYYADDGELLFANQTYWDYFGINEPMAGEHYMLDVVHPEDHLKFEANLKKLDPENPVRRTLHRMMRNGESRWIDWIDRAVYSSDDVLIEYQGVGRDVTDYVERQKIVRLTPPA